MPAEDIKLRRERLLDLCDETEALLEFRAARRRFFLKLCEALITIFFYCYVGPVLDDWILSWIRSFYRTPPNQ